MVQYVYSKHKIHMETLRPKQELEKTLADYNSVEILDAIYDDTRNNKILNIGSELETLSFQKEKEAETLDKLIQSSEKQASNPRIQRQIHTFKQKLEEIQTSKNLYEAYSELNSYHLEGGFEIESDSLEFLIERYRTYQTILQFLDESDYNPARVDIESIIRDYYTKILEVINDTGVDKKYGFGYAVGRPMSMEKLSHLIIPDTENPEFDRYKERLEKINQGNARLLTDGQITNMQDDLKGSESEKIVAEELAQVPGVLATIDIPKFSIGDTRHKADTIAVTINPDLAGSITDQEVQLAIYRLIEEYKDTLLNHMHKYGASSLISPKDKILGDIIKVNRNIKLDDIKPETKEQYIDLEKILQIHKIQIKTQSSEMSRALAEYKSSKMAIDPDKVGFLAREYHQPGNPQADEFSRAHFQIAAQKVLGLPIQ